MYTSKYFTCEEIDQRLLQGYYDDAVLRGFTGTLNELWQLIFSIADKANSDDVRDLIEKSRVKKVSELENDLNYQTKEQVEAYISKLVNGADEALDTLLELAEALGNDPNFAATMAKELGSIKDTIEKNATSTKESFQNFQEALKEEINKREEGDKDNLQALQNAVTTINESIASTYNNLDTKVQLINQTLITLQQDYNAFKEGVNAELGTIKDELSKDFDKKIKDLEKDCKEADKEFDKRITQNTSDIQSEVSTREAEDKKLEAAIENESAKRIQGDANLQSKIADESNARVQGDADLQSKIDEEIANRREAVSQVTNDLNTEKNARQLADENLQNQINNQSIKHDTEIKDLEDKVAQETSRVNAELEGKVDKEKGKGLSTNDFTNELLEKLNGIEANANFITRVSELINDAQFVDINAVNEAIQKVIGAAPEALDTLQELADALGNDPNFATTLTNKLTTLATQLNQEIENRADADEALKEELVRKIQETSNNLTNSYNLLSERLNTYKTLCDKNYETLTIQLSNLDTKIDEKSNTFLERVIELSDSYSEKIKELTNTVNQFTNNILNQVNSHTELINQNTANIQRNLELIQTIQADILGIKDTANNNLTTLLEQIKNEADSRKSSDEALSARIDANAKSIKELDDYIKDNPVQVNPNDNLLSVDSNGIKSEIGLSKEEQDELITYQITGKDGQPIPDMNIEVANVEAFTEQEAEALFNKIYE